MSIIDSSIGFARKVGTALYPHLPTIGVVTGSALVCAGAFFACKATLKVDQVFDEHKAMLEHIEKTAAKVPAESYTDKDRRHDKLQTYAVTAGKLFKLYAPAIGIGVAGFASIFAGFGLIKKWHAVAVSTIATLDERFADYRKAIIERYGNEIDQEIVKNRGKLHKAEVKTTDDDGTEKTEEVDAIRLDDIVESDFTRRFDWRNPKWTNDFLMNDNFLTQLELWYTKHLQSGRMDHIFLNTVLKDLGYEGTEMGHWYGWTRKPGCCVDFQILPYISLWDNDDEGQFPMIVPLPVAKNSDGIGYYFINADDEDRFRAAYASNEKSVGYILKFNVDADENGVPRQIYNDVYGNKDNKVLA